MIQFDENKTLKKTKIEPETQNPEYISFKNKPDTSDLKKKISGNQRITHEEIADLIKETQDSKVLIFGQEMTKKEFKDIPDQDLIISKEILSGHKSRSGLLTHLFPDVLHKLLNTEDWSLIIDLNGLDSLTDEQAELLSKKEIRLSLKGIKHINDAQAESFSKHKGWLFLGISAASNEQIKWLSMNNGHLELNNLINLNDEQLKSLSTQGGGWLSLDKVTSISDDVAKAFSGHLSKLYLDGITSLSVTQAEWLSKHDYGLSLNGIKSITNEALQKLLGSDGDEYETREPIFINGLTSCSDEQAEAISKCQRDVFINGVTSITDKQAEILSHHKEILTLGGLTSLTDKQIYWLGKHTNRVNLPGIEAISDYGAEIIANTGNFVFYNNLVLTEKQAEILAKGKLIPIISASEQEKVNKYKKQ